MAAWRRTVRMVVASVLAACAAVQAHAEAGASSPLTMVRSLQFVQDAVAKGDHSAIEMQRHLLRLIDERLREADPAIFEEPANVDAALIYSMSGGNPATLGLLASRDEGDNFDDRLVAILHDYLSGRGSAVLDELRALLPDYRNTRIDAYLSLVTANISAGSEPASALDLFDRARLLAPGTIVEEAALRRSLDLLADEGRIEEGLVYAGRYARRFLHSPYAGQFADLFVKLVIAHSETINGEHIAGILGYMDPDRRRSVYLRIARQAAIKGERTLAALAAEEARVLSGNDARVQALAGLYAGVAGVPSDDVVGAAAALAAIDAADLTPNDRALRQAAARIAAAVVRLPEAADIGAAMAEDLPTAPVAANSATSSAADDEVAPAAADGAVPVDNFVASKRAVLETVDGLLEDTR